MKRLSYILTLFVLGLMLNIDFSHAYSPFVKNYKTTDYKAASQNWAIAQGLNKNIYVGNHYGLLEFDGYNWRQYTPGFRTTIRSILIDDNGRIYVGFNEGFGYFEKDEYGELVYTALSKNVNPETLHNREIWSISSINKEIYFQSFSGYFTLGTDSKIKFTESKEQISLFQKIDSNVYLPAKGAVIKFDGSDLEKRMNVEQDFRIEAMCSSGKDDEILIFTNSHGVWKSDGEQYSKWDNQINQELTWATPNRAVLTKDSLILVGTILNGLYALNIDGTLAWHINNGNGLQNNTILGISCDTENNIWLALDNGISVIYNTNFLKVATWRKRDVGAIYDVKGFANKLMIATNQGLFKVNSYKDEKQIDLIPGTEGYILSLFKIDENNLLIGHNNKTLLLENNGKLTTLSDKGASMCTKPLTIDDEDFLMQSSYTNLTIFAKNNGKWGQRNVVKNFNNPIKFFEIGHNETVWATHFSKGLFRIKMNKDFDEATHVNFYPALDSTESAKIGVFKMKNRIIFTDSKQCYTYDDLNDKIVPYDRLNDHIGHFKSAHRIVRLDDDKYWFITQNDAALISIANQAPNILSTIAYEDYDFVTMDDYENIVPMDSKHSLLCFNNGIAQIYHDENAEKPKTITTKLELAWALAFNGTNSKDSIKLKIADASKIEIPYSHNNLRFGVSFPVYETKHKFRYQLKGLNNEKMVSDDAYIEYARIPYGAYTLEIETINSKDEVVATMSYSFSVAPPFYASTWAYILYTLLAMCAIYLVHLLSRRRELNQNKKLRSKQEKEIIKLENEKLADENKYKSKELASYAMSMIRQTEILTALKKELDHQKEQLGTQYPNKYYQKMVSIIEPNISSAQEWEVFQTNFDRIHEKFFRNLRQRYPELTSSDLKLCALLRLNLDNKEIANLMNITIRAIETRRYRMRRKLNLGSNENLTEFLIDFK